MRSLLGGDNLAGVDILTKAISFEFLNEIIIISILVGVGMFLLSLFFEKIMRYVILPISYGFFGYYIFLFATSVYNYNATQASILLGSNGLIATYTISFALISLTILYIGGFVINSYLYAPHWLKEVMQKIPIIGKLFQKHHHHHIHFHDHHDDKKHDTKEEVIEDYILKSLDSGHEMFYIVEHLVEHNWPVETIEKAISMAKHDKLYKEDVKHVLHYHHNKDKIERLAKWIKEIYNDHSMKDIINRCLGSHWTEDDIILAFKYLHNKIKIRKEDAEVMRYMTITS